MVACDVIAHQHQVVHLNRDDDFFHDFPPQCDKQSLTMFLAATGQQEECALGVDIACNQERSWRMPMALAATRTWGMSVLILPNQNGTCEQSTIATPAPPPRVGRNTSEPPSTRGINAPRPARHCQDPALGRRNGVPGNPHDEATPPQPS